MWRWRWMSMEGAGARAELDAGDKLLLLDVVP